MKPIPRLLPIGLLIVILLAIIFSLPSSPRAVAQDAATTTPPAVPIPEDVELPLLTPEFIPTSVPTPSGPLPAPKIVIVPTLTQPLTPAQAVRKALEFEQRGVAQWVDEAWSLETQQSQPERITVEQFEGGKYGPLGSNVKDSLWVVTIKGRVRVGTIGGGCLCSGVTYAISEKTGNVVYWGPIGPVLGESWCSCP